MIHLRDKITGRLRVVDRRAHPPGMEPLARTVRDAMDAAGLSQAEVAELTKLSPQHIQQIVSRRENYTRPPKIETLQALARIPNLSIEMIAEAVAESTGMPRPAGLVVEMTPLRRSVHTVVDKIPEDELARALQILTALL